MLNHIIWSCVILILSIHHVVILLYNLRMPVKSQNVKMKVIISKTTPNVNSVIKYFYKVPFFSELDVTVSAVVSEKSVAFCTAVKDRYILKYLIQ